MYSIVILSIVVVAASAGEVDLDYCRHLMHYSIMRCCNKDPIEQLMKTCDVKDCNELSGDPVTCARDKCIAKAKGFATADDKLDLTKLEAVFTKDFASNPDLLAALKKNCIEGDLEKYGAPEFCDIAKMMSCFSVQLINSCAEWSEKGSCEGVKEYVKECDKLFSQNS